MQGNCIECGDFLSKKPDLAYMAVWDSEKATLELVEVAFCKRCYAQFTLETRLLEKLIVEYKKRGQEIHNVKFLKVKEL